VFRPSRGDAQPQSLETQKEKPAMSTVDRISAVLPVTDIAEAEAWYARFFGRPADATPMPSLREWHEGSGGFAVLQTGDHKGPGYATMHVASLEDHRALLMERGLTLGARQNGDAAGLAQISDPAGNIITIVQRRSGTDAVGGGTAGIVRGFFEAFRARRRGDAEAMLAADFTFTSPFDDHIDRDAFFDLCWPNGELYADMRIERVTPDSEGAYITYFVTTKAGKQFRNSEYLGVTNGQVHSTDVYFGANYERGAFAAKRPSDG
jgi:hypothetical protein